MAKINVTKLEEIRTRLVEAREEEKTCITVCGGTGCHAYGCLKVADAFKEEILERGLQDEVTLRLTGCHGFCERGPIVVIQPDGIFYQRIQLDDIPEVMSETVLQKKIIPRLLYVEPRTKKEIVLEREVPFYKKQKRIIFENNGFLDPTDLENYIALDGYKALSKALFEMTSEEAGRSGPTPNISYATPMKGIPGRTWTAACWKEIPTASSKAWSSGPMP
jgi:NADH-quinone oxidoreductase subunit F